MNWVQNDLYERIFHTLRMEGNKMTLTEIKTLLQTGKHIIDRSDQEHNEVEGIINAFHNLSESTFKVGTLSEKVCKFVAFVYFWDRCNFALLFLFDDGFASFVFDDCFLRLS